MDSAGEWGLKQSPAERGIFNLTFLILKIDLLLAP